MSRRGILTSAIAFAIALSVPSLSFAYFPPDIGIPTPVVAVPPDPFGTPDTGGLGEPEIPDPGTGPNVQTPEPASIVTGLVGLAMAGAYGVRKRKKAALAV